MIVFRLGGRTSRDVELFETILIGALLPFVVLYLLAFLLIPFQKPVPGPTPNSELRPVAPVE